MPGFTCCVPGCYNNSHRDRELRFYTFPKNASQREIWLKNISRAGVSGCFSTFQPTSGHRVCSVHFQGGRKTYTIRVPTLFPLRGVNERRNRRGRGRKTIAATAHAPIYPSVGAIHGHAQGESELVVQIGQNGEYASPRTTVSSSSSAATTTITTTPAAAPPLQGSCAVLKSEDVVVAVVADHPEELLALYGEEHSYSLSNGTTSAELLRKLNEQRDIIALMEVKMKEMKNTIRQLRVNEARLQEELRERERQLSGTSGALRKKV